MLLHTVDQNKWLYLAADVAVIQLNTEQCQLYTKCFDCIRDPHCGWNTEELRCQRYQSGLSQDAVTACSSSTCFTEYQWAKVIPGMSLHLNCSSPCLPDGAKVTWLLLPNHATSAVTIPVGSDANYVLSADNGLVILSVNASQHVGTFQCMYNNHIVTQHNISLSVCRYGNWNVWLTEYRNYCKMFDQYVMDYNEWQDLKDKCQSSNCIDTANKGS